MYLVDYNMPKHSHYEASNHQKNALIFCVFHELYNPPYTAVSEAAFISGLTLDVHATQAVALPPSAGRLL